MTQLSSIGPARQQAVFVSGVAGYRPLIPVASTKLEQAAHDALSPAAWAYIAGSAGRERTARANQTAFDHWRIVPRVLHDVSRRDFGIELFGQHLPAPVLLAPIGVLEMAHRQADLAVARAAAAIGVPFVFSSQASVDMETCAAAMGDSPRWFQLYWSQSSEVVKSFVRRAEACGCSAIVLTLDTTLLGWRPRDLDLGSLPFLHGMGIAQYTTDPAFLAELHEPLDVPVMQPPLTLSTIRVALDQKKHFPGGLLCNLFSDEPRLAVQRFVATYSRPSLQWDDLPVLRGLTRLPIVLKGLLHPDDARRAVEAGMDGVIVSNHGGRQVDGATAALDALPGIVDAVQARVPVLFDSGIRTGSDVFKALALGARAVLLGRPYVYGLALAGECGVRDVILNVLAELDLTMGLSGCRNLQEVTRETLTKPSQSCGR
ncbi:MAG TPA: lactate 2-monooxygenase [Kofleriaceae bacterium]|jgi:lactate 2-monooxygenase|nr:lactate 2-monooxygenase [Kofleriaceae bacterium]